METAIKHLKVKVGQLKAVTTTGSTTIFNMRRKEEIQELETAIKVLEEHDGQ